MSFRPHIQSPTALKHATGAERQGHNFTMVTGTTFVTVIVARIVKRCWLVVGVSRNIELLVIVRRCEGRVVHTSVRNVALEKGIHTRRPSLNEEYPATVTVLDHQAVQTQIDRHSSFWSADAPVENRRERRISHCRGNHSRCLAAW